MTEPSTIELKLDADTYSLTAVKKAAYRFADRGSFQISQPAQTTTVVAITRRSGVDDASFGALPGDFLNELLDQDLRERVAAETDGIRKLIMAHALSRVPVLATELEDADPPGEPA